MFRRYGRICKPKKIKASISHDKTRTKKTNPNKTIDGIHDAIIKKLQVSDSQNSSENAFLVLVSPAYTRHGEVEGMDAGKCFVCYKGDSKKCLPSPEHKNIIYLLSCSCDPLTSIFVVMLARFGTRFWRDAKSQRDFFFAFGGASSEPPWPTGGHRGGFAAAVLRASIPIY